MALALGDAFGRDRIAIAVPRGQQSAVGHAITLHEPIHAEEVEHPAASAAFLVDGTPADCVKLAVTALLKDEPPVLCVSGINNGPNVGVNVFYSGTVGAALEAVINGVPAVAVSKEFGERLGFPEAARLAAPILEATLARIAAGGLPPWHALNVNLPDVPAADVRGIRLTRQGVSGFDEWYEEQADARDGFRCFRIEGEMRLCEKDGSTDAEALAEGCISVTPLGLDLTSRTFAAGAGAGEWKWAAEAGLGRT
jgi:5'-nucleotidase